MVFEEMTKNQNSGIDEGGGKTHSPPLSSLRSTNIQPTKPIPKGTFAALVAQSAERVLGKDEVGGSNPLEGSTSIKL